MEKIKVSYWDYPNIGDLLGPYIIKKLTNKEIITKDLYSDKKHYQVKRIVKFIFRKITYRELKQTCFYGEHTILSVGSILKYSNKYTSVWGSGFMYNKEKFRGGKLFAVRGPLSNQKIIDCGYKGCDVFGDPALLLPLFIKEENKKYDIAIIPHYVEYEYFKKKYGEKYKIINLHNRNIQDTVKEITSCKAILSTSLHGIIISHAYNIPAIWIKYGNIDTDGFKFYDYFGSVNIPFYEGFVDIDRILETKEDSLGFISKNIEIALPKKDVKLLQKKLLLNTPFKIIDKYHKFLR